MEGQYFNRSDKLSAEFKATLKGEKDNYGICSLSAISDNKLKWAYYANGHTGIAIGVEVSQNTDLHPVEYKGLSGLSESFENKPSEAARQILSRKLEIWDYEEEYRAFVLNDRYVEADIKEAVFGRRVSPENIIFFKKLFSTFIQGLEYKEEV